MPATNVAICAVLFLFALRRTTGFVRDSLAAEIPPNLLPCPFRLMALFAVLPLGKFGRHLAHSAPWTPRTRKDDGRRSGMESCQLLHSRQRVRAVFWLTWVLAPFDWESLLVDARPPLEDEVDHFSWRFRGRRKGCPKLSSTMCKLSSGRLCLNPRQPSGVHFPAHSRLLSSWRCPPQEQPEPSCSCCE